MRFTYLPKGCKYLRIDFELSSETIQLADTTGSCNISSKNNLNLMWCYFRKDEY